MRGNPCTYEECLCHELSLNNIPFERQALMPVVYKGIRLDCGYRVDIIVDKKSDTRIKISGGDPTNTQSAVTNLFKTIRIEAGHVAKF